MLVEHAAAVADILACPACGGDVLESDERLSCPACAAGFDRVAGKDVLVDFANSALDRAAMLESGGASVWKRDSWRALLGRVTHGVNPVARHFARTVLAEVSRGATARPRILVVGGGAIGSRAEDLYTARDVEVIAFDIYASPNVTFLADAHRLPIKDASVDAVWVQAVLEHTLDPQRIVAEIHRVLKPDGVVFATTAFLWPVCEGAWDYYRWTPNGLRWLFRDFAVVGLGSASGLGTGVLLSLRMLAQSLLRSTKAGQVVTLPFFWLRFLDRFTGTRRALDAAPALFFYGRRADTPVDPKTLPAFYEAQHALEREGRRVRG